MKQFAVMAAIAVATGLSASSARAQITVPTVQVGNPGNAADTTGYGAVAYTYNIGSTEVTNAQYAAFLNAVASTDSHDLYDPGMVNYGGITRSGSPGSYTYATEAVRENHPVPYVSFWNATRFANWLHNGQPTGPQNDSTTEDGAYTLTPSGITNNTITRNASWRWAVTSEDEWYKAAYHQPAAMGGPASNYWRYPTSSNTITTAQANFDDEGGDTRPVGSYAANFYGTFDMGGNLWEMNEAIINGSYRGSRGGSFNYSQFYLSTNFRGNDTPWHGDIWIGFRISQVPGATCLADLNTDGTVDGNDFIAFINAFGAADLAADVNADGVVDGSDFVAFINAFGAGC